MTPWLNWSRNARKWTARGVQSISNICFHLFTSAFTVQAMLASIYIAFITTLVSLSGWTGDVKLTALWHEHLSKEANPPTVCLLQKWYSKGSKLARLAAGGEHATINLHGSLLTYSLRLYLSAALGGVYQPVRTICASRWKSSLRHSEHTVLPK